MLGGMEHQWVTVGVAQSTAQWNNKRKKNQSHPTAKTNKIAISGGRERIAMKLPKKGGNPKRSELLSFTQKRQNWLKTRKEERNVGYLEPQTTGQMGMNPTTRRRGHIAKDSPKYFVIKGGMPKTSRGREKETKRRTSLAKRGYLTGSTASRAAMEWANWDDLAEA